MMCENLIVGESIRKYVPTVEFSGNLIYLPTIHGLLRGFAIERSPSHRGKVRVSAFVQSLYIPSDEVALYLTCELRNAKGLEWWSVTDKNDLTNLSTQARKVKSRFLDTYSTPKELTKINRKIRNNDPYLQQEYAYALARCGQYKKAQMAFRELASMVAGPGAFKWEVDMGKRALVLADQCEKEPDHVKRTLEKEIILTGQKLRVE